MELRAAKVISFILHPIFIPFYIILVLSNTDRYISVTIPFKGMLILSGIVLFTTVLLPLLSGYILVRLKIIRSIFPKMKDDRIYLLLNTALFYYLTYYLIKGTHFSVIFNYFMLGSTILVVCSLLITFLHQISLHMIAAGGLTGGLIGLGMN